MHQEHTIVGVKSTLPTVEDALTLARMGFAIIPLAKRAKVPPKGFTGYQTKASTDPDTIQKWWTEYPDANIGHITPTRRLVVDVDARHNGLQGWQNLCARHGALPPTWKVQSGGGGFHLYFTVPQDTDIPYCTTLDQGVEVLGAGHIVVMPPSIHPHTGQAYTWDEDNAPDTFLLETAAPDWLLELTLKRSKCHNKPATARRGEKSKPVFSEESNKVHSPVLKNLGSLCDSAQHSSSPSPGAGVVAMACTLDYLPAMLDACGLSPDVCVGETTQCPMHDDAHPSAVLLGPTEKHRSFGLYCHASTCQRYYSLTDIYHAHVSGNLLHLHTEIDAKGQVRHHTALRLQWTIRLLEAAGVLHIRELGVPTLPSHAPEEARDLWTVFLHVRRIRSVTRKTDAPLPFSWRFIQDWTGRVYGWTSYAVNRAKRWLISHGFLELAGKDGIEHYWRVGRPALRRARRDAPVFTTERAIVEDVAATVVPEPPQSMSACPDAAQADHNELTCEICLAQARILAVRRDRGIQIDYNNPYGYVRCEGMT